MSAPTSPWYEAIAPEILAAIRGRELLIQHLGYWPKFHDFEVLSIALQRQVVASAACDLLAVFLVFDLDKDPDDPERRQGTAELHFESVEDLRIHGFNYQNPILGISIVAAGPQLLRVAWGGAALPHEVSFTCQRVSVARVVDLNPFRRSSPGL